jgi:hypothetical protein
MNIHIVLHPIWVNYAEAFDVLYDVLNQSRESEVNLRNQKQS